MNYRINQKNGDRLSILGFGCMRFPKDEGETERLILRAIEQGINYFDTAYIYGNSETILGRILKRHNKREQVKIATKIPPAMIRKYADLDKYFNQQLVKLQTDYIDYYFIHMITDEGQWQRLKSLGIEEWITAKKAEGKIRSIGFSYHGGRSEFIKVVDAYDWEFCMIQYNYLDENNQACRSGLKYAHSRGLPVMVMEPLRGGMLARKLPPAAAKVFENAPVNRTPAEWSFRWIWDQEEVLCVLSGMNAMPILEENLTIAATASPNDFTVEDHQTIQDVKEAFAQTINVPCTGCNYCMPCPKGVDIPTCLSSYNNIVIEGRMKAIAFYMMQTGLKAKPELASLCNQCGLCERKCPQGIPIRKELKNTAKELERFYFKPVLKLAKWIQKF